jgi:hypothetical protein
MTIIVIYSQRHFKKLISYINYTNIPEFQYSLICISTNELGTQSKR